MSDLSALSQVTTAISGFLAGFRRWWPDMSGPWLRYVRVSDTQQLDFLEGYKKPSRLSSRIGHSFHLTNTLKHYLDLSTSLLQASFKSKLLRRDLSLTLEWYTRSSSQSLHWRSSCVRYSWRFNPLDEPGCPGVTKVVVDPEKFILPSFLWWFNSKNWTRSWWSFRVDYDWKRPSSLWASQRRCRHPLWVIEF
jgi:hypothetical protein